MVDSHSGDAAFEVQFLRGGVDDERDQLSDLLVVKPALFHSRSSSPEVLRFA